MLFMKNNTLPLDLNNMLIQICDYSRALLALFLLYMCGSLILRIINTITRVLSMPFYIFIKVIIGIVFINILCKLIQLYCV